MENIERRVRREARAMTRREVVTKALVGELSWVQAAQILGVTDRHMRRIRWTVENHGLEAVMDQRGGRPRRRRVSAGTVRMLCRLKRDVYPDFSVRHFYEQVSDKHQLRVSYNWLRLMLQEAGVVAREPARGKYRRRRERRPMIGMLVHLDASTHEWIAGRALQDLVVALDDADGRILYAAFFAQEGTALTFAALESVLRRCGRFCELYTDRGSHFCHSGQAGAGPAEEHTDRSPRLRIAFVSSSAGSMAIDDSRRSSLGPHGPRWSSVHGHRSAARAAPNRIPTRVRGLVISCSAACGGLRNARAIGIRGSLLHARGPVWRWSCGAAAAGRGSSTIAASPHRRRADRRR